MHDYMLIRSARRTIALEVNHSAELIVRAPNRMPKYRIDAFVAEHGQWIDKAIAKVKSKNDVFAALSEADVAFFRAKAAEILPQMTKQYADRMGLSPSSVKITSAKTRFGSCGRNGHICYSWRLMLYPAPAWDYVVVHELCHLRHFNHSEAFYASVAEILPDYKSRMQLLKTESSRNEAVSIIQSERTIYGLSH